MKTPAIRYGALLAALLVGSGLGCGHDPASGALDTRPGNGKKLLVLGVDGMDPTLAAEYMAAGRMPNLAALAKAGSFGKVATSSPPESPVAWSDFITARHSEGHGIYDFVHRDPKTMSPYLSTSRVTAPKAVLSLGPWALPVGGGKVELLRAGTPFWSYLDAAGIPSSMMMIPAAYPPPDSGHARVMAGMGTPDLLGTYGVFQLYTNDDEWKDRTINGGRVHMVKVDRGVPTSTYLSGPPDPLSSNGRIIETPFDFVVDATSPTAVVRMGNEERVIKEGEWSDWVPVSFDAGLVSGTIHGMVRIYAKSLGSNVTIYVTPLNIDPTNPAQPFATPGFSERVAASVGRFYTLGIPEDEKALEAGVFDDGEYLKLISYIFEERSRMLDEELSTWKTGLMFVYFGSIDQLSHAYFRTFDPTAPEAVRKYKDAIPKFYERIDALIGKTRKRIGEDTPIVVMSDHGFAPYDTKVNLNTWLKRNGYLVEKTDGPDTHNALDRVDWSKTKAYALGLNLLYVNLRGREPNGIVGPDEKDALLKKLKTELEALVEPASQAHAISNLKLTGPGDFPDRTPDAIVGYARGFRSSDASAVGATTGTIFERNEDKWHGDHCIDAKLVPAMIATTLKIRVGVDQAALVDLGPTILDHFGVAPPSSFVGKTLLLDHPAGSSK